MLRIQVEGRSVAAMLSGLVCAIILWSAPAGLAATVSFQQGVNGWTGVSDTWIGSAAPDGNNATSGVVEWDGEDNGGQNYGLLRFSNIFGTTAGQIPPGALINSATLTYVVTNSGNTATVNEVLVDWDPPVPVTWNTFGGSPGVQSSEYGNQVGTASGTTGSQSFNVTSSLAAWSINPSTNKGWIFRPTGGTDGVEFVSSESGTVSNRPKLTVTYTSMTAVDLSPDSISTVVGKANVPVTVSIPPGSNTSGPVQVTVTTSDASVAVPVGAVGGSLVLDFTTGAPTQQNIQLAVGQAGSATISTANNADLENDSMPVSVSAGSVSVSPAQVRSGAGTRLPVKISITSGSNETREVNVQLTSADTAVVGFPTIEVAPTIRFPAGAASSQWIDLQCGQIGSTSISTSNDGGLADTSLPVQVFEGFNFTVTADPRTQVTLWGATLAAMQDKLTTAGVFHISPGDIDPLQPLRDAIDTRFGPSAIWYPLVGNHEVETPDDMTWVRSEYHTGNGVRTPLKNFTNQDGPPGTVETTFSWDYGNAHFISLNQYWNGQTAAGSDVAADGDIVPALYNWLAADLAANTRPVVFVFGHEPAFPFNRHVGDSLDKYPANRDAFWALLHTYGVQAYFCGHTHFYSKYQSTPGGTWQIDVGNAGNDPGDGQTFANVMVTSTQVTYEIWRNKTGSWLKQESWLVPVQVRLAVTPNSVDRTVRLQSDLPSDTLSVDATGVEPISYTVTVQGAPSWVSITPQDGVITGSANLHQISYSTAGLSAGEYTASIVVSAPAVANSPQIVPVKVTVAAARADFDADNDVDQSDFGFLQACLASGPATGECLKANLNGDTLVDAQDLAVFLTCFAGPNQPIPAECPW